MPTPPVRIGIMAPAGRIPEALAERVQDLAGRLYPDGSAQLEFHPQCFLSSGHFAGDDRARRAAFMEIANDGSFDALWFARGGYGSCRFAGDVTADLTSTARGKVYLGYSDIGFLHAVLYRAGFTNLVHGPMPGDMARGGGEAAVTRALAWLVERSPAALDASVSPETKAAAFNITVLSHLLGTPLQPDLAGHVLMLEDTAEHMYRIDRALFHITSDPGIRKVAGIRLGRCAPIPHNEPAFGASEEEVVRDWCSRSAIPYLGRADIGHDAANRIVPFGRGPDGAAAHS